jgi:hypothetical protein
MWIVKKIIEKVFNGGLIVDSHKFVDEYANK